jgi:retron-type reverse transcriptase
MENLVPTEAGTPQGAVISPLLANIYLHYAFDLWADQWRKHHAKGQIIVLRYADDIVIGFQHERDAKRFMEEMRLRLEKSFHFLGFTHICSRSRRGVFQLKRQTRRDRMRARFDQPGLLRMQR